MKRKTLYLLFFLSIILYGCNNTEKNYTTHEVKISKELAQTTLSDFVSNIKYVQLELSNESLIGRVAKLEITKDRIYIADQYITKSLFVFDINGKFLFKVRRIGNGPGEYQLLSDFCIDKYLNQLILFGNSRRVIRLDYNGNFISEQKLPNSVFGYYLLPKDYEQYIIINSPEDVPQNAYQKKLIYFTDKNFKIQNQYIDKPKGWERMYKISDIGYSMNSKNCLFTYSNATMIYEINSRGVLPKYHFNIPEKETLTKKIIDNLHQLNDRDFVMRTFDYFSFDSYFELKDKLFVTSSIKDRKYWGIYDSKNDMYKYVNQNNIINDDNKLSDFVPPKFLSQINDSTIAGTIDSKDILKKDSVKTFNGFTVTKESNPLIVICTMKK